MTESQQQSGWLIRDLELEAGERMVVAQKQLIQERLEFRKRYAVAAALKVMGFAGLEPATKPTFTPRPATEGRGKKFDGAWIEGRRVSRPILINIPAPPTNDGLNYSYARITEQFRGRFQKHPFVPIRIGRLSVEGDPRETKHSYSIQHLVGNLDATETRTLPYSFETSPTVVDRAGVTTERDPDYLLGQDGQAQLISFLGFIEKIAEANDALILPQSRGI